jgi:large repetitive protein
MDLVNPTKHPSLLLAALVLGGCSLQGNLDSYVEPDDDTRNPADVRAAAGPDQQVEPGALVVLDGRSSTGPAPIDLAFQWRQIGGEEVTFATDIATPSFTAPVGRQDLLFELTVSAGDDTDDDTVVVEVGNSAPLANAGPDIATDGGPVQLDASGSTDADGDTLAFTWTQSSGPSVELVAGDSATAHVELPNARADYVFSVLVADASATTSDEVTVSVGNHAPIARAGDPVTVDGGSVVQLDATGSLDPDGDPLQYRWHQTAGDAVALDDSSSPTPSLRAPLQRQELTFELVVDDGIVDSAPDTTVVQIANNPPIATILAPTEVAPGDVITLDASESIDPDGDVLEFAWELIEGDGVEIDNPVGPVVSFAAPAVRSAVTVRVQVRDGFGGVASGDATISVGNGVPTLDAGPDRSVHVRETARVTASGEDPDGDPLSWRWAQTDGPAVEFEASEGILTFQAPNTPARLAFRVTVSDDLVEVSDFVSIQVDNTTPVADAGADVVADRNNTTQLDGSLSMDPDADPLEFAWSQTSGAPVALDDPSHARPTFVAPADGQVLTFELTVDDGVAPSPPDSVRVTVRNDPPVADAGTGIEIDGGAAFTLSADGSSDVNGDPLTYTWDQIDGDSAELVSRNEMSVAYISPVPRQQLVFEVTVDDGLRGFSTDTVTVDIRNNAPVANPGPTLVVDPGSMVTVDGSQSRDVDGDPLTFSWRQISGEEADVSSWTDPSIQFAVPEFRSTALFGLIVSDGERDSLEAVVEVSVRNSPPISDAGADRIDVDGGAEVELDGRDSFDQDEDELTFLWEQISGEPVALDDASGDHPKFRCGIPRQSYAFRLTVHDGLDTGQPDTVTVTTRNNAPVALAGADRDVSPGRVTVSGSGTDVDRDQLSFSWSQHAGPPVVLGDANTATVWLVVPPEGPDIELDLTVTDPFGAEHTDRVKLRTP